MPDHNRLSDFTARPEIPFAPIYALELYDEAKLGQLYLTALMLTSNDFKTLIIN